jgi:hypothetical protein
MYAAKLGKRKFFLLKLSNSAAAEEPVENPSNGQPLPFSFMVSMDCSNPTRKRRKHTRSSCKKNNNIYTKNKKIKVTRQIIVSYTTINIDINKIWKTQLQSIVFFSKLISSQVNSSEEKNWKRTE